MVKRFLQLEYTAIKRYGAKHWQAYRGSIAINTNYVVSCSQAEAKGLQTESNDTAYIVELSNGTKFLTWLSCKAPADWLLSDNYESYDTTDYAAAMAATRNSINSLI